MVSGRKVAVYCRVARKDQIALKHQIRQVARCASELGHRGGRIYQDNGESGATIDRPAFNRLNRDMLAGKVQTVVIQDLSRISRNYLLTHRWLDMADALGVEVVSVTGDVGGTLDMEQLREFVTAFAQKFGDNEIESSHLLLSDIRHI